MSWEPFLQCGVIRRCFIRRRPQKNGLWAFVERFLNGHVETTNQSKAERLPDATMRLP